MTQEIFSASVTSLKDPGFFREKASSASLEEDLKATKEIGVYLKKNKESMIPHNLPIHLDMLLAQKGISKPEVVRDSQLDRKYIYQIFSGEKNPSRDKLIALAFGLHLSDEETQTMLKVSGNRELYVRDERDAIILFALQKKKDIWETNELLSDHNFTALGAPKD